MIGLFYPRICGGCDAHLRKHEQNVCINCLQRLPKTYYWDYKENPIEQLFWGKIKVDAACGFLHFGKDSTVQQLMHRFKYKSKTGIGHELGRQFAIILRDNQWFIDVDVIVPIPLHPSKQLRRGYNQSDYFAEGISEVYDVPARSHAMIRMVATDSQTRKSRFDRSENVEEVFRISDVDAIRGKNVLLVDDVVTTGATLEAAGNRLLEAGAAKLYIAVIAVG
ncbi:MAG: ComF family protein [Flavobacteriales bacterium]|nr:ComF family protein [Flavobacteriales bacterium]